MPGETIHTTKTVAETLADLRKVFRSSMIEDFEAIPLDGAAYSVRYHNGATWIDIISQMQATKAMNLRQCYQVVDNLLRWQARGISGLASGQSFMTGLAVTPENTHKASEFIEACGTLGVDPESSWAEIQDVYRVKVKRAHPDAGGDPERFKRLNRALELIKKVKVGESQPGAGERG